MCADTGLPRWFVKVGNEARIEGGFVELERRLRSATARATHDIPLRPNRVHPLSRRDHNNNVGLNAPEVEWSFEPDADWIWVAHQGGPVRGFSNMMPAFGDALTMDELGGIIDSILMNTATHIDEDYTDVSFAYSVRTEGDATGWRGLMIGERLAGAQIHHLEVSSHIVQVVAVLAVGDHGDAIAHRHVHEPLLLGHRHRRLLLEGNEPHRGAVRLQRKQALSSAEGLPDIREIDRVLGNDVGPDIAGQGQ